MAKQINAERLKHLWQQWITRTATKEEVYELFELIKTHRAEDLQPYLPINYQTLIAREKLSGETKELILHNILKTSEENFRTKPIKINLFRYAAAVAFMFSLAAATYFYFKPNEKPAIAETQNPAPPGDVLPGTERAILTLSDGSVIELDNASDGLLAEQQGSKITKEGGQIKYLSSNTSPNEIRFNTMSTPKGGLYHLILPDGTKVWLNAASSITYPTAFSGNTREVNVTGELYFEVTKNKEIPFIVKTHKDEITVRGTSFNVNSYTDEQYVKTSLLEGSVWIGTAQLQPGEAHANGKVFKEDVQRDVAWKNGAFSFKNADLKTVMRQLSRWYNLDVIYEGEAPKGKFSGEIGRTLTLNQLLKGLTTTKIKYRLEDGNKLVIISD